MQREDESRDAVNRPSGEVGEDPWALVGELEAEVAELRCLLEESRHREALLRDAVDPAGAGSIDGGDRVATALEVIRLQERLQDCTAELRTIRNSKGWRLIQALRGLVGRRW
jgi:hypothetical protein